MTVIIQAPELSQSTRDALNENFQAIDAALDELTSVDEIAVDYGSMLPIDLDDPDLEDGELVIEESVIPTGSRLFLGGQANGIENGVWVYNAGETPPFARPVDFDTGQSLTVPTRVVPSLGINASTTYSLVSAAVVDTDATEWTVTLPDPDDPEAITQAGFVYAGPQNPTAFPGTPSMRLLRSEDIPRAYPTREVTTTPQSPNLNFNRIAKVSAYAAPNQAWANRDRLQWMLQQWEFSAIDVDEDIYIGSPITAALSRKRLIFHGNGFNGGGRVIMNRGDGAGGSSFNHFLDLAGSVDFQMIGECVGRYSVVPSANSKFIKAQSTFTNFKADKIITKGVSFNLWLDTAHQGFQVGELGVNDILTETPFFSNDPSGSAYSFIRRIIGLAPYEAISADANTSLVARINSPVIDLTGTLTANRVLSLSNDNVDANTFFTIRRTGGGAFTWDVGGLVTLRQHEQCTVVWDPGAAAWKVAARGGVNLGTNSFADVQSITANSANTALIVENAGAGAVAELRDQSSDTTPTVVTTSGQIVSGDTQSRVYDGVTTNRVQLVGGVSAVNGSLAQASWVTSTAESAKHIGARARGGTAGTHTDVIDGNRIFAFESEASIGGAFQKATAIYHEVDATPASGMPGRVVIKTAPNGAFGLVEAVRWDKDQHQLPGGDNVNNLGSGSKRYKEIFSANATINTSSRSLKTLLREPTKAERAVAMRLRGLGRFFRWNDSVRQKGEEARMHFGLVAEDVIEAFAAEKLNAFAYGMVCADRLLKDVVTMVTEQHPKMEEYTEEETSVEVRGGVPTLLRRTVKRTRPVGRTVPVVDENGAPVFIAANSDQPQRPMTHFIPDLVPVEVPVVTTVETDEIRYGLRYEQVALFILLCA